MGRDPRNPSPRASLRASQQYRRSRNPHLPQLRPSVPLALSLRSNHIRRFHKILSPSPSFLFVVVFFLFLSFLLLPTSALIESANLRRRRRRDGRLAFSLPPSRPSPLPRNRSAPYCTANSLAEDVVAKKVTFCPSLAM